MNFINGQWIAGTGEPFTSINPANESTVWEGQASCHMDIQHAVDAAHKSFPQWKNTPVNERIAHLQKFQQILEEEKDSLAQLISEESGKPRWESLTEVNAMLSKVDISIAAFKERCGMKSKEIADGLTSITRFNAIGPVVIFGPFNLPCHLPNGHIVPALLAGNTILFKPSECTPSCGQKIVELWNQAGLPAGVLNLLQGAKKTGSMLVKHEEIKGVLFTGSYYVGRAIHKALAGRPDVMLVLEMGGNNPLIIWDCENVQAAAFHTTQSAFLTSGQRCVCSRRLILPNDAYGDRVLNEILKQTRLLKVGLPDDKEEPFIGPLINKYAAQKALNRQRSMLQDGAKELIKMTRSKRCKLLLHPGILDVTDQKNRRDAELFAPLLQVIRVPSYEAAIDEVNNTEFGLAAGLISDSEKLYKKLLSSCSAGIINWNRQITGAVSSAPFGGTGNSGNYRPSAYFAADYCSYPVASLETSNVSIPSPLPPGSTLT